MRLLTVLLPLLMIAGCSKDVAHEDAEYLETVLEGLRLEMSAEDTRAFFQKQNHHLQIYCEMALVEELTPCANGYRSTGIIKLPSSDPEHGVGVARVYLRLNGDGILKDYFHDLYYEKLDNR
ncbi:MAG: hypothetical protein L3J26_01355 [Candidatus Polarisedimenticolaceae bacterium]|nr:hypothetical protein [Candidatus Polarisedimenticolaceae bacterium]